MEWKVEIHMTRAIGPDQRADAAAHLAGGLVGEGDGEHLVGGTPRTLMR